MFLGNGDGAGRPVLAEQRRGDGSGVVVHPWGAAGDTDAFEVRMRATHPGGRGRVQLEVETCPAGMPFGDAGCLRVRGADWSDVGATDAGVALSLGVGGLTDGTLQRWRAQCLAAHQTRERTGYGLLGIEWLLAAPLGWRRRR